MVLVVGLALGLAGSARAEKKNDAGLPSIVLGAHRPALLVDGKPFRMRAGQLGNSSASTLAEVKESFSHLVALGLNTVLVPVTWELIEPQEGKFAFDLVAGMIAEARKHDLRVVPLWFGAYKNSMSSYAPAWVKRDVARFPRAELIGDKPIESLSAFSRAVLDADRKAFAALMREVKRLDPNGHTVILVQVENNMAGVNEPKDSGALASAAWKDEVPAALLAELLRVPGDFHPGVLAAWGKKGKPASGSWSKVFAPSPWVAELFTAWHYARFVDEVVKAGKAEHPLPMFVNATPNRPGKFPGQYPSGGPVPHLLATWRLGAPSLDVIAPEVYFGKFDEGCGKYKWRQNPLLVPGISLDAAVGVHALYAFGQGALGFSPFAIEKAGDPEAAGLKAAYALVASLDAFGEVPAVGVLVDKDIPTQRLTLGGQLLEVNHEFTFPVIRKPGPNDPWPISGGLILATGPEEFLVIGRGLLVTFAPETGKGQSGFLSVDEGQLSKGKFVPLRRLNGDETDQGRHVRLPGDGFGVQKVVLYRY